MNLQGTGKSTAIAREEEHGGGDGTKPLLNPIEQPIARIAYGSPDFIKPDHAVSALGIHRETSCNPAMADYLMLL